MPFSGLPNMHLGGMYHTKKDTNNAIIEITIYFEGWEKRKMVNYGRKQLYPLPTCTISIVW